MHRLGFIAHYSRVPLLQETVIVDPQAIITAISHVITMASHLSASKVKSQAALQRYLDTGVVQRQLLDELWSINGISDSNIRDLLVQLLVKFDLVSELKESNRKSAGDTSFIVPSMMPNPSGGTPPFPAPFQVAVLRFCNQFEEPICPIGVYFRLVSKCVRWCQLTNDFEPQLFLRHADVAFGSQRVRLLKDEGPSISVHIAGDYAASAIQLIEALLQDVLSECYNGLRYTVYVGLAWGGARTEYLPLSNIREAGWGKPIFCRTEPVVEIPPDALAGWMNKRSVEACHYDAFLSYRVSCNSVEARALSDCLEMQPLDNAGRTPNVFFDQKCLLVGRQWDISFAQALSHSAVYIPLISPAVLSTMTTKTKAAEIDNVLLEWLMALELHKQGLVKSIVPVVSAWELLGKSELLPDVSAVPTNERCLHFLNELGYPSTDPAGLQAMTPAGAFSLLCRFQAVLLDQQTTEQGAMNWDSFSILSVKLMEVIKRENRLVPKQSSEADEFRSSLAANGLGECVQHLEDRGCKSILTLRELSEMDLNHVSSAAKLPPVLKRKLFALAGVQCLAELLERFSLGEFESALVAEGCNTVAMLRMLDEEDFQHLVQHANMVKLHQKRFLQLLDEVRQSELKFK
eukprot:c8529_g1_i2.p1 GENE.c8529_g1_i2~~c8529_g1_i2.p1  ORF type:complete len:631 (-),score=100.70 c8529_g1_i2:28-1920(-)